METGEIFILWVGKLSKTVQFNGGEIFFKIKSPGIGNNN
jgi:hypothetical protein